MSNSRPLLSLSVDSRKLRTGDLRLSPESEDDVEASPQSGDASEADVPSSPEDQDQGDVNMDASSSSSGKRSYGLDGSSSIGSGKSYGMDSSSDLPLPEDTGDFGAGASLSCQVQGETTLPKMDGTLVLETQQNRITSRTVPQEDFGEDFHPPVEAETSNPSVAQEGVGLDVSPSAEVEGLGVSSAAPAWKWGDLAPSPAVMDVPPLSTETGLGEPSSAGAWKWGGLAPPLGDMEVEESQRRLNLVGPQVDMPQSRELTAAAIHRAEQIRLQRIHCQIRAIYEEGNRLTEIVDAMIEELDSAEVQDIIQ